MGYTTSQIQAVKDMVDLREVVSRDVIAGGVRFKGQRRYVTNSPLREDNNPSMWVTQDYAFDFGLYEGFDYFDYMEAMHKMSFREVMGLHTDEDIKKAQKRRKKRKPPKKKPFKSPLRTGQRELSALGCSSSGFDRSCCDQCISF